MCGASLSERVCVFLGGLVVSTAFDVNPFLRSVYSFCILLPPNPVRASAATLVRVQVSLEFLATKEHQYCVLADSEIVALDPPESRVVVCVMLPVAAVDISQYPFKAVGIPLVSES